VFGELAGAARAVRDVVAHQYPLVGLDRVEDVRAQQVFDLKATAIARGHS
jgi:uncharacterized protein with HEPN domain